MCSIVNWHLYVLYHAHHQKSSLHRNRIIEPLDLLHCPSTPNTLILIWLQVRPDQSNILYVLAVVRFKWRPCYRLYISAFHKFLLDLQMKYFESNREKMWMPYIHLSYFFHFKKLSFLNQCHSVLVGGARLQSPLTRETTWPLPLNTVLHCALWHELETLWLVSERAPRSWESQFYIVVLDLAVLWECVWVVVVRSSGRRGVTALWVGGEGSCCWRAESTVWF